MLVVLVPPVEGRQPVQTRRSQISTHVSPFAIYYHQYYTLVLSYHTLVLPYSTFYWYIIENLGSIAENPPYSTTQELVRLLYCAGI